MFSRSYQSLYHQFYYLVAFVCLGLLGACRSEYCETTSTSETLLNAGFYRVTTVNGAPQDSSISQRFRSIHAPGRTNLVANTDTIRAVRLRLPIAEDTATFIFERRGTGDTIHVDTLQFTTGRRLALTSQACEFNVQYGNMQVIRHTFDSLAVEKAALDTSRALNVKIYY